MGARTYRQPSCAMFAGGLFAVVGGVLVWLCAYHMATGIPLWQADSKFGPGRHIASSGELWFGIAGGIPMILFGLLVILSTLNCAVSIDDQGIVATNLLKRTGFRAKWTEITSFDRMNPGAGSGYTLVANGKTLKIQSSTVNMKDLVAEIQRRTPNIAKP